MKYTKEQEDEMYDKYKAATDAESREIVVLNLVKDWGFPKRSIIAKLSKMKIYVSKAKMSKLTGNKPETKEQIVSKIEHRFGVEDGAWIGLEKAPKMVLIGLLKNLIQPKLD